MINSNEVYPTGREITALRLAILLTLFAIVAITIQYPSVQTSLTEKATKLLSEQLKTDVHVGEV
ncbi:MAG: hypothetical protein R2788_03075 [Saprospiraceae bacterium]